MAELEKRVDDLEQRVAKLDVQFAVINTKLSLILWGLGISGAALIGILVKYVFPIS